MMVLLTGGARSGKSAAAVRLAAGAGRSVVYVATAEAGDDEMTDRIRRHRKERPPEWTTLEAPIAVVDAIGGVDADATVILDCLALWVTNQFDRDDEVIEAEAARLLELLSARRGTTIIVTNEVGSGVVPDNAMARRFRDTLGRVNAFATAASDRAFLCAAGGVLELAPVDSLLEGLADG